MCAQDLSDYIFFWGKVGMDGGGVVKLNIVIQTLQGHQDSKYYSIILCVL